MNRAEHLAWAKTRAIEYIDRGELQDGLASMISDLHKHDELADYPSVLFLSGASKVMDGNGPALRQWVEGFN